MYKVHSTSPYESRGSCICLSPWTPLFSPRCQNPIGSPSVFASSGPKGQIDPYFLTGGPPKSRLLPFHSPIDPR